MITFGVDGDASPLLGDGWSVPEGGFTWTDGPQSSLSIPYAAGDGILHLLMRAFPMRAPPAILTQRVCVIANDVSCGTETLVRDTLLAFPLSTVASGKPGRLSVILQNPDAARPADHVETSDRRLLGLALREIKLFWAPPARQVGAMRRPPLTVPHPDMLPEIVRGCTGLVPIDLMFRFASLGHNCEFGLVQRLIGAEPLSLLRFAGVEAPELLEGLNCAFEGIADPGQITLLTELNGDREEFLVRCERYGLQFHSFMATRDISPETMRTKMSTHLSRLRSMFEETLQAGSTMFVLHHPACTSVAQARPYLAALRAWGSSALLFVTEGTGASGSADRLEADLFVGHIDRLMSHERPDEINAPAWLSICANVYRLWREGGGGGG
jgi:hypothetical protein